MPGTIVTSIGLALGSVGISLGFVGTQILTAVVPLAPAAIGAGYQAIQASKLKKQLSAINDDKGIQQILKQTVPAQRLVLGTVTQGGAMFFYEAKPPYIWYGILLAGHPCGAFKGLYVNGHDVRFTPDGFATTTPYRDGANKYLEISYRSGDIDQAIDPIIARDFPNMPSTFRQRGHATLVIKAHYGFGATRQAKQDDHEAKYGPTGRFTPLVRHEGALAYDPRKPGHVLDDESTWAFTSNAILNTARFLTHGWPDTRLVDSDRLDWDRWAIAADEADRWDMGKDSRTFRRHTADGVIQSTDDPYDVIDALRTAALCHLVIDRGRIYPVMRQRRPATATIHLAMLRGPVEYVSAAKKADLVNIVNSEFIAPEREYQMVNGPVLRRSDLIALDGQPRAFTLRGSFVEGSSRIQRLQHAWLKVKRAGRGLSIGVTIEALDQTKFGIGCKVRVAFPEGTLFALYNGEYEVVGRGWDERLEHMRLTLREAVDDVKDFDPATDEQDFTLDDDTLEAA